MGSYQPLISVTVEHIFFEQRVCQHLEFVPTPKTRMFVEKAGLLTRSSINRFSVFYDENKVDVLQLYAADPQEPLQLGFKVFSRDKYFENYTQPAIHKDNAILYFSSQDATAETSGKYKLHDEEFVTEEDFKDMNSQQLQHMLSEKDKLVKPLFVVDIHIEKNKENKKTKKVLKPVHKDYYITFNARHTLWKYYLLGNFVQERSYIADLDNKAEFEYTGETTMPNNSVALTFRSKKTIPLQQTSELRFQLREKGAGGGKVLIKRLPVASECQISREIIKGKKSVLVSEIYINC